MLAPAETRGGGGELFCVLNLRVNMARALYLTAGKAVASGGPLPPSMMGTGYVGTAQEVALPTAWCAAGLEIGDPAQWSGFGEKCHDRGAGEVELMKGGRGLTLVYNTGTICRGEGWVQSGGRLTACDLVVMRPA